MTTLSDYKQNTPPARRLRDLQDLIWNKPSAVTFWIGAGFGKLFANLPIWSELLHILSSEINETSKKPIVDNLISHGHLQVAAELLSELQGSHLSQKVCKIFQSENHDITQNPLCAVHPGTVVTTNYDTILERIFPEYKLITPRDSIESIFNFSPKLVKLHGSIEQPESIILNVSSYARAYDKEFEWFLAHIFQNTTVLFIGCSLDETEPYMKLIRLLSKSNLLKTHHYAILPFRWKETKDETNTAIRDRSNELETIGIRTLPYIVQSPKDHKFVEDLLVALQPISPEAVSGQIIALDKALDTFGPANIGPGLFRLFNSLEPQKLRQKPFLSLTVKFLRTLREDQRYDLGKLWRDQIADLINYHQKTTEDKYAEEFAKGNEKSSKAREILSNKAFLYDANPRSSNDMNL